jgi:3-hydroxyacyl-CoA dehydrogenase/enoyl-CoA hydratase/3-hydroxybutyryl-CoA epimerase
VLVDKDQAAADRGKSLSDKMISDQVKKGRAKPADRDALLARIKATADYNDIAGADLVVEAVFEDRKVKADVIARAETVLGDKAIFGSNTSTLPITSLAEVSKRPDRFVGIHFFSPVERMMLVEVIKGKKTGDEALAVALDFVRAIKKTPIVVNDSRGFYTSRVVGTYIREGHLMLTEGVPAAMVENVGRMAGMPVGPLSLNDEVAVDLAWKIVQATKADLGADAIDDRQEALLEEMVVKRGRLGRKNGKGFYDYPENGPKRLWLGLVEIAGEPRPAETFSVEELKQRFLAMQALETARCVEEGVITDVRDADVGGILGFGYAPFTGGPLSYIDGMGVKNFVALCERLKGRYGPRFKPAPLLVEMAKKGETFYTRFAPSAGKRAA